MEGDRKSRLILRQTKTRARPLYLFICLGYAQLMTFSSWLVELMRLTGIDPCPSLIYVFEFQLELLFFGIWALDRSWVLFETSKA